MNDLILELPKQDIRHRILKRHLHRVFVLGTMVSFGMALFSCAPANDSSGAAGSSSSATGASGSGVDVRLSDAPGNFEWFQRADVTISGATAQVLNSNGGGQWVALTTERQTINLLDLRGGLSQLLGHINLPNGSIRQIRLLVESASVTLTDGRVFPLKVPSGSESGLKVFITPSLEIVSGQAAELMLDFDVSKSFVAHGNPRSVSEVTGFLFKPVIRVGNSTVHGSISGEVYGDNCTPNDASDDVAIANASVQVFDSQSAAVTANSSVASGAYAIYGLSPDRYSLQISAAGFEMGEVFDVDVVAGNNIPAGRTTLAKQSCPSQNTDTATDTATDTSTGTSTSTDTGTVGGGSSTATSTDTSTATSTSTSTDVGAWNVFGFDATSDVTSISAVWQTQVPTTAVFHIGLTPDDFSYFSVLVNQPDTVQFIGVDGLDPDTVYYLKVTATDANGVSHESVTIMKKTKPLP